MKATFFANLQTHFFFFFPTDNAQLKPQPVIRRPLEEARTSVVVSAAVVAAVAVAVVVVVVIVVDLYKKLFFPLNDTSSSTPSLRLDSSS